MTLEEFEAIFKERDEAKSPYQEHAKVVRETVSKGLLDVDKLYKAATKPTTANAKQVAGNHYKTKTVQPWDVIDTLPHAEAIGFYRGNAIKYLMRAGSKMHNPARQDYEKALHYIEKLLETLR